MPSFRTPEHCRVKGLHVETESGLMPSSPFSNTFPHVSTRKRVFPWFSSETEKISQFRKFSKCPQGFPIAAERSPVVQRRSIGKNFLTKINRGIFFKFSNFNNSHTNPSIYWPLLTAPTSCLTAPPINLGHRVSLLSANNLPCTFGPRTQTCESHPCLSIAAVMSAKIMVLFEV